MIATEYLRDRCRVFYGRKSSYGIHLNFSKNRQFSVDFASLSVCFSTFSQPREVCTVISWKFRPTGALCTRRWQPYIRAYTYIDYYINTDVPTLGGTKSFAKYVSHSLRAEQNRIQRLEKAQRSLEWRRQGRKCWWSTISRSNRQLNTRPWRDNFTICHLLLQLLPSIE